MASCSPTDGLPLNMDGFPPNVPTFGSTIDNSSGGGSCYHDIDDASFESSWTLSTILTLARESGGLSEISADRLQKCLEPVVARLQQIDAEALLQLKQVESGGARLRDGVQIKPIHNEITPVAIDYSSVRYVHLQEAPDQYSMGIFVFPPHAKIPLHDHPGMCVISRVLYGDLQRLSLDLPRCGGAGAAARKKSAPHGMCSWMSWSHSWAGGKQQQQSRRLAYKKKNAVDYLSAPDCTVLYPFEGNLHEFVAGPEGAAVLDVLLPPYDTEHHRDCTFYQLHDYDLKDNIFSAINSSSDDHRSVTESGEPCWIIPTGQPEDFHCLSGKYRELGG